MTDLPPRVPGPEAGAGIPAKGNEGIADEDRSGKRAPTPEEASARAAASALSRQGWSLLTLARYDEAEAIFGALRKAHPDLPVGYAGMAAVQAAHGGREDAVAAWEVAAARFPLDTGIALRKCNALHSLGRHAEVVACVDALLEAKGVSPGTPAAFSFSSGPLPLPPPLLTLYCKSRFHLDPAPWVFLLADELDNYRIEGQAMDALFGESSCLLPWFGNGLIDHEFPL